MKKNVLIFGSILGTILCVNMLIMVNWVCQDPEFQGNDFLGYVAMVIVFSLTFFGILNYRNKQLDGSITIGKAFQTGALIALVGSTMYVVVWLFYYYLFVPEFIDKYTLHVMYQAAAEGLSETKLAAKREEMTQFKEMYQNPLFVVLITYAEVLPLGLVVAFVGSLILKRKPKTVDAK
ncbi:MAG: DUF4199 domain-containing protein [Flavobacteriales bacterium]